MKALKIMTLLLFAAGHFYAQKTNVETAFIAISKYAGRSDESPESRSAYLKEAKQYIDKAKENETTSNYDKMWFIRGKVYYYIYRDTLGNNELDPDPALVSVTSLVNYLKMDGKKRYEDEAYTYLSISTALAFNEGVNAFFGEKYDRAMKYFEKTLEAIPVNDEDKLKKNNVDAGKVKRMVSTTAIKQKNQATAKKYLEELISKSYADPSIYSDMKNILLDEGDTVKALEYLDKGRQFYPDNQGLVIDELNTYIRLGKLDVLIQRLTDAIDADPYNEHFYFNRGTLYQGKATGLIAENEALAKEFEDKAIADFEKALEINPQFGDVLRNLGKVYLDRGIVFVEEANSYSYKEKTKYEAALEKAKGYFSKAIPYLETAYQMDDGDLQLTKVLMDLYLKTENLEKYKELKSKLEN